MPLHPVAGLTYAEWRDLMLASHDCHVDASRARYLRETAEPTVADLEAEMSRAKVAIASIRADIAEHLKIKQQYDREHNDERARLVAEYIAERTALIVRHEQRVAHFRARVDAIEERRVPVAAE